jgi:hypothetical protein
MAGSTDGWRVLASYPSDQTAQDSGWDVLARGPADHFPSLEAYAGCVLAG